MKDGGIEAYVYYSKNKKEENRKIFVFDVIMNKWEDILVDNIKHHFKNAANKKIIKKVYFYINAKHSKLF